MKQRNQSSTLPRIAKNKANQEFFEEGALLEDGLPGPTSFNTTKNSGKDAAKAGDLAGRDEYNLEKRGSRSSQEGMNIHREPRIGESQHVESEVRMHKKDIEHSNGSEEGEPRQHMQ